MLAGAIGKKILEPLKAFVNQGISSRQLSLSIAFGLTLGTIPILGVTIVLCTLAALTLRLNQPIIHFANLVVSPLQMTLLAPYYYLGNLLFSTQNKIDFGTLKSLLTGNSYREVIIMLLDSTLYAVGAWLVLSPLMLALVYIGLKPILVRLDSVLSRSKYKRH